MPENYSFSIRQLTNNDDQYWRVDWFGYLQYFDDRGRRRSEPLVDVFLSPFKKRPNGESLFYKNSTNIKNTRVVKVPISYLRILRLGDVWHRGSRMHLARYREMMASFRLDINRLTTETSVSGAKYNDDFNIIPYSHHPYHDKATKTYCEVTELDSGDLLVVPSYVILQAYFSSSQYLFQQLFKFGLEFESIFDPSRSYIDSDGKGYILLKKWTHDAAASEAARIAFDENTQKTIANLSRQFALQLNNKDSIRPKVRFPFEGQTNLQVYGKWCPLDFYKERTNKRVFIVYDILKCTAKFPFNTLKFFRDNPGDKDPDSNNTDGNGNKEPTHTKPRPNTSNGNIEVTPSEEPSNEIEELELEGRGGTIFTDLFDKEVQKERQEEHIEQGSLQISPESEELQNGNTGEGDSDGNAIPVDFNLPEDLYKDKHIFSYKICRLEYFKELVRLLGSSRLVQRADYLQAWEDLGNCEETYSFFPVTYTSGGRASKWQYINYIKGVKLAEGERYKHRRALIAKLELTNGVEVYLVETERRIYRSERGWVELDTPSLFLAFGIDKDSISEYQFTQLLESCSKNRGTWIWESWMIGGRNRGYSIRHASNSSIENGDYLDRQISIIEKYLGFSFN